MKILVFNRTMFLRRQTIDALTCPINRDATRRAHNCDDWELWRNPNLLLVHYITNGGAVEFAKRRNDFLKEIEIPVEEEIEFHI